MQRNVRTGKFHLTPAEWRTRYDIASRLLLIGERPASIAKSLHISVRQCQRMLRDADFNAYYDEYRKAQMAAYDKAVQGRIIDLLPLIPNRLRQLIMQDDSKAVALQACIDVLDRCRIEVQQSEKPASLMPAQLEALTNAAKAALRAYDTNDGAAPAITSQRNDASPSGEDSETVGIDSGTG